MWSKLHVNFALQIANLEQLGSICGASPTVSFIAAVTLIIAGWQQNALKICFFYGFTAICINFH